MTTLPSANPAHKSFQQSLVTHSRFSNSLLKKIPLRAEVNREESIWKSFLGSNPIIKFLRPDFYLIFSYTDSFKILYQENINLDFGGLAVTLNNINSMMLPADQKHFSNMDETMSNLIRERQLQPWDYILKTCGNINSPNPQLKRLMRTNILIHSNRNGQASIGFMCFHDITDMVSAVKPNGFEISCETELSFLSKEIEERLKKYQGNAVKPTRREVEIIQCIRKGMSSKEIASTLYISVATVNTHRQNMLRKWEVPNTAALIQQYQQMEA
jgi:DNA-binding CsgD family transcriptional regulator